MKITPTTMKFAVRVLCKSNSRLGSITELKSNPETTLETPLVLACTKSASIPHLTREVLELSSLCNQPVQIPLSSTLCMSEAVKQFGNGIAEFSGLKGCPVYCTIQDPCVLLRSGYNDKAGISIWGRNGRKTVDVPKYMSTIEAFKPDFYQALCDGDTDIKSSKKRSRKAMDTTLEYLDKCLERHNLDSGIGIFGVIEGGYSCEERQKSAKLTADRPVDGFVLDGFHKNGQNVSDLRIEDLKPILADTLVLLPSDKPRIFHGSLHPLVVIELIELGIDIFDSSFAMLTTEQNSALVFPVNLNSNKTTPKPCETGYFDSNDYEEISASVCKAHVIDFTQQTFTEDFSPILENCTCYTCRKFTRAYISHLVNVRELLAPLLLQIHNLHHYQEFFKTIQIAMEQDEMGKYKHLLSQSFGI